MTRPIVLVDPSASALAVAFGRYPAASITRVIRSCSSGLTCRFPLSTYDTVLRDTPASFAISPMFTRGLLAVANRFANRFARL
jgi:hypothetical protein